MTNTLIDQNQNLTPQLAQAFEWLSSWDTAVNWLKNQESVECQRSYSYTIGNFLSVLGLPMTAESMQQIKPSHVIAYRDYLVHEKKQKPRTVRNRLSAIKSLCDDMVEAQEIRYNPATSVKRPKVAKDPLTKREKGVTPAQSIEQAVMMMSAPDISAEQGARDAAILNMLYRTGCRDDELGNVPKHYSFEDKGVLMLRFEKVKGGGHHDTELHPLLRKSIEHYLDFVRERGAYNPAAPLFQAVKLGNNTGGRLSDRQFRRIYNKYRVQVGLDSKYTVHSTRKTFATVAELGGATAKAIQKSLNHADIRTTQSNYMQGEIGHEESAVYAASYVLGR